MAKAGRPRKADAPRNHAGKIRSSAYYETTEDARAVALAQPHRQGDVSQLAGTPHGRALKRYRQGDKASGIDWTQYEAADAFAKRRRAFLMMVTSGLPKFGSTLDAMIANGGGSGAEPHDEAIAAIRSNHREVMDALSDAGMARALNAMTDILVMEVEPPSEVWPHMRPALNAIATRLNIRMPDAQGGLTASRARA